MAELAFVRAALVIARGEVVRLARDRRALFAGIVLPALVYPLFFHGQAWLRSFSARTLSERTVRIALDLEQAPADVAAGLSRALGSRGGVDVVDADRLPEARAALDELRSLATALHEGRPEALERRDRLAARLLEPGIDAVVSAQPHPVLPARCILRVFHDGSSEASNEALGRVEAALAVLDDDLRTKRVARLLEGDDPASGLDPVEVDLASAEATGGAALGRMLPLLAVLVLISGGSFAALSAFAGEREAGTLETLLVQPLPSAAVAWGKFYAVLAVSLAALCCNVGSLMASLALGLGALPGLDPGQGGGVVLAAGSGRLGAAALVFLPTAVLISGLLALISTRARSFREGQHLLLPLTLVAAVPAGVAGFTEVPLDPLLAAVPLLGPCLAAREALRGTLSTGPALVAVVTGTAWAALTLRALAGVLSAERILQQPHTEREAGERRLSARSALGFGLGAVLGSYVLGGWLQARFGLPGLMVTLWGFLPLMALLCARRLAARAGTPLAPALGLRAPRSGHVLGALLVAPALAAALRALVELQDRVAPLPSRLLEASGQLTFLERLSPLALFAVLALSPGICEELFFRGPLLAGLRRDLGPVRAVLWQALLFGAAHASVHRFGPTAVVGVLLGALTLRTRSVLPAILLHVAYDGLQVLAATAPWTDEPTLAWLALPGLWLLLREPAPGQVARATPAAGAA